MEEFNNIREVSYKKYASFNKFLTNHSSYNIEIPNVNTAEFRLGKCMFKILPVLSTLNSDITLFDRNHPTGLNFLEIDRIVGTMNIPKAVNDFNNELFALSYKLSAIVCDKVNGAAFLSVTKDNYWLWFVVLNGSNQPGKKYLQMAEKVKVSVTDTEMQQWYQMMNI
jgi:hypothetical protein